MAGPGFAITIRVPPGITGITPTLVSLLPNGYEGTPAAIYSDGTIRNEAGAVLHDIHTNVPLPPGAKDQLSIQGGQIGYVTRYADGSVSPWVKGDPPSRTNYINHGAFTSREVARQVSGAPLLVSDSDPRDPGSAGGVAVGEQGRTWPLFVAGVMPREEVYDRSSDGGWGAPVAVGGPPSSWSRRDDRWIQENGDITDAQGTVLGHTNDRDQAARELSAKGATPSIDWTGQSIIYGGPPPPPSEIISVVSAGGSITTLDGTGRVVNAAAPIGSQTMKAVPPDQGWEGTFSDAGTPAPIVHTSTPIPAGVTPGVDVSAPASGAGTAVAPRSVVDAPPVLSSAAAAPGADEKGIPLWAILVLGGLGIAIVVAAKPFDG